MSEADDTRSWLDSQLDRIQGQLTTEYEAAIVAYFGSVEEAYAQAPHYVFEERPAEISYIPVKDSNSITLRMETQYRIRRKRADEYEG